MKNTHIEHPEDSILTGDLSCLDWFCEADSTISIKMDGAPAIVWGTDPATGTFFVGTKSVFNKVKIKIAHSHREIDQHYAGNVATILHKAFDCLPRTDMVIQGDFIGYGGSAEYTPNTITYHFPEVIEESIIVCPHTIYVAHSDLRDAVSTPLILCPKSTEFCKFVQPDVYLQPQRDEVKYLCEYAKQMSSLCEFMTPQKATKVKKFINDCIRNDNEIDPEEIAREFDVDAYTISLWKVVDMIKDVMFKYIHEQDDIECMIGDEDCLHEGYVMDNKYGMFKIVYRDVFSRANFNIQKAW